MNFLAHIYLSADDVESRLGNFMGDFIRGDARDALSPAMRRGVECHREIDGYTDRHALTSQSRKRISRTHNKWAGVLTDVFYDHYLAINFERYAARPLPAFVAEVYKSFQAYQGALPTFGPLVIDRMIEYDWLGSYTEVEGIRITLERMSRRLRRPYPLADAISELTANYNAFGEDFAAFFPELDAHIRAWWAAHPPSPPQDN